MRVAMRLSAEQSQALGPALPYQRPDARAARLESALGPTCLPEHSLLFLRRYQEQASSSRPPGDFDVRRKFDCLRWPGSCAQSASASRPLRGAALFVIRTITAQEPTSARTVSVGTG